MKQMSTLALMQLAVAVLDELDSRAQSEPEPDPNDLGTVDLYLGTLYRRENGWQIVWNAEGCYEQAQDEYPGE